MVKIVPFLLFPTVNYELLNLYARHLNIKQSRTKQNLFIFGSNPLQITTWAGQQETASCEIFPADN